MKIIKLYSLLVLLYSYESIAVKLAGPLVYVVTPSSNPRIYEGRSAPQPFYYHNWMRRMDSPSPATTSTTTTTPTPKKELTPDLIFAEFESDKMKNIRKLLEKERIDKMQMTTTTTSTYKPIYVLDEDSQEQKTVNSTPPSVKKEVTTKDMTDYFALYNNMYNHHNAPPAPVYLPTTLTPKPVITSKKTTTTTTAAPIHNVENIWDIIDSQKQDPYSGQWDEVPIESESDKSMDDSSKSLTEEETPEVKNEEPIMDGNFALPGFGTNPGMGGENESRAIRTEPNIRFPYVNLKPFQMKNLKKPHLDVFANSKKSNNMYTNLDNFVEIKRPVRGEVQDVSMRQPVDRYNPAQPYLPSEYGSKSKQSSPSSSQTKTVANLVPPPPPPPPKVTDNDFPVPSTYEQFPPFAPSAPGVDSPSIQTPALLPSLQPPSMESDGSDSDSSPGDDEPIMNFGYRYKPPEAPKQSFLPTLPPLQKPGYSYDKPSLNSYDAPPMMTVEAPPANNDFQGYSYDKPMMPERPDFLGYHYKKPEAPASPPPPPSYGHHDSFDYPELIYNKPHADHGSKGEDDMKGGDDSMGMAPPPMADTKPGPPDDSGFPHDFPDFKYPHDFDDHDFHHYHHHHPTTTTTTTEMPRVNRYSYYYLGKKLYYLPLYFSVYFIVYVGALIIKAVLRHKIVYPNSWRPNDQTASFFNKRSVDSPWDSSENLHEITGRVTRAIATAAERYIESKKKQN